MAILLALSACSRYAEMDRGKRHIPEAMHRAVVPSPLCEGALVGRHKRAAVWTEVSTKIV
eukprot:scaffold188113_cov34-Tisochrysis_lutea.AAC.1